MSGVLGTGLGFWQIIGLIFAFTASIVAIKITFNFDLNKFLDRKDKRLHGKVQNICPHVEIKRGEGDHFSIQSLFESPSGTLQWQCGRCGLIRNNNNNYEKEYEYWSKHPDEYLNRMKKFQKLLKKGGVL
jgi:hypothetical protein